MIGMNKYYTYEIENLYNGNLYRGVRGTNLDPIEDSDYMGSGTLILRAIKKYGKGNFKKTILEVFDNKQEASDHEYEIVNEEWVSRDDTYNLVRGGLYNGLEYATNHHYEIITPNVTYKVHSHQRFASKYFYKSIFKRFVNKGVIPEIYETNISDYRKIITGWEIKRVDEPLLEEILPDRLTTFSVPNINSHYINIKRISVNNTSNIFSKIDKRVQTKNSWDIMNYEIKYTNGKVEQVEDIHAWCSMNNYKFSTLQYYIYSNKIINNKAYSNLQSIIRWKNGEAKPEHPIVKYKYTITDPKGNRMHIVNLNKWCMERNLSRGILKRHINKGLIPPGRSMSRKKLEGYRISYFVSSP